MYTTFKKNFWNFGYSKEFLGFESWKFASIDEVCFNKK